MWVRSLVGELTSHEQTDLAEETKPELVCGRSRREGTQGITGERWVSRWVGVSPSKAGRQPAGARPVRDAEWSPVQEPGSRGNDTKSQSFSNTLTLTTTM